MIKVRGGVILKTFFIAIADVFLAIFTLFFKFFNSLFNSFSNLIFKDIDNNDKNNFNKDNYDENDENSANNSNSVNKLNNRYNKNNYNNNNNYNNYNNFNKDNNKNNDIFSKLKNNIFSNKDDVFIFKQLQLNSNSNKPAVNGDDKDDSYWSKKYNAANDRITSNMGNVGNIESNDKNLQRGYLNKIIGKRIAEIIDIKLFIPSVIVFVIILTIIINFLLGFEIAMAIILLFLIIVFAVLYLPKMNKDRNRSEISKELPYALRQMVTELRSGKGLHDTISSIASSDYGALSYEFSRVIEEIKYGENTEKALINMSNRVSSEGLSRAVQQIIGTLRTGGNLASTLNIIAEDISYDLQIKLKDYSQKLNAFIMIYTFLAILGPVILLIMLMAASTVMGDIVPANVVLIMYIFFFPMIVVFMGLMIKRLEPKL